MFLFPLDLSLILPLLLLLQVGTTPFASAGTPVVIAETIEDKSSSLRNKATRTKNHHALQEFRTNKGILAAGLHQETQGIRQRERVLQQEPCAEKWKQELKTWKKALKQWEKSSMSSCYNMIIDVGCFCPPDLAGPFNVTVVDDVLMTDDLDLTTYPNWIPTISGLFDTVYNRCFKGCPTAAEAFECRVAYATFSKNNKNWYISSVFFDIFEDPEFYHDTMLYQVLDLTPC